MNELTLQHKRGDVRRRLLGVVTSLLLYSGLTAVLYREMASPQTHAMTPSVEVHAGASPPVRNVTWSDGFFIVDGERILVKAVGWDPVRPGERPWNRDFDVEEIDADLNAIHAAGFNTVRTWAPLRPEELALVARHGMWALQGIWVPPTGDFSDPAFRRAALERVRRDVEASRWSPAVLGYLVLNEPRARAVAHAGLDATTAFLREVVATVRSLDPSAPIGFASWPGMEALDDPLLDFVAFNVYPHRPRAVMDGLGMPGYLRLLQRTVARGRPLLISEFGVSVSPESTQPGRGGATQEEQARGLCDMGAVFEAAGVAGTAVFQWSDGWWKNNDTPGDEMSHDPRDPEEWFGLMDFASLDDRHGHPRPALRAFSDFQRALVATPRDGATASDSLPVQIYTEEPLSLLLRTEAGASLPVPLRRVGSRWLEGTLPGPSSVGKSFDLELLDRQRRVLRREHRALDMPAARHHEMGLEPHRLLVRPGSVFSVDLRMHGSGAAFAHATVAAFSEDRFTEESVRVRTDRFGRAHLELEAPDEETLLTVLAYDGDPAIPSSQRAADWSVVEVRRFP